MSLRALTVAGRAYSAGFAGELPCGFAVAGEWLDCENSPNCAICARAWSHAGRCE